MRIMIFLRFFAGFGLFYAPRDNFFFESENAAFLRCPAAPERASAMRSLGKTFRKCGPRFFANIGHAGFLGAAAVEAGNGRP